MFENTSRTYIIFRSISVYVLFTLFGTAPLLIADYMRDKIIFDDYFSIGITAMLIDLVVTTIIDSYAIYTQSYETSTQLVSIHLFIAIFLMVFNMFTTAFRVGSVYILGKMIVLLFIIASIFSILLLIMMFIVKCIVPHIKRFIEYLK